MSGVEGARSWTTRSQTSSRPAAHAYDDANVGDADEDDASTERCDESGASDLEDVNNPAVEDEIPRQLNTGNVNDDGNPYFNLWSKMYQNSNMWATNPNGSISVTVGDMFIDKDQWSNHNGLASFHWVANALLTDFKANPTMGLKVMQEIGLIKGMVEIFTESRKRICDVHYNRNFSKDYPGAKLHMLFWTACNAYTKHVYKQTMESIKKESKEAYE
ncbi:hypothetical protein Cgig2_032901 [Carnegiea gigantea]|uniref:Uncharacterized protein n=1 Tax=Carnegiea gigantea TaxID=171969 RepID=A0A9Q1JWZ5_9CARY|nr:hypothetical protein Cgig2_032901 [Carnegiea gigantea]